MFQGALRCARFFYTMRYIWLPTQSPYINLATEEYLLTQLQEDIFMLWQNADSVIIGRHQNTLAEINEAYVKEHNITIARRLTGGGAVFHDLGNLNFSFIRNIEPEEKEINFVKFLQPIVDALQSLGVPATFSGRNDLMVHGKKISGNAMVFHENRVLEHGTLLFSTMQNHLAEALRVDPEKFKDKAVKSVRSRVTNISEHLKTPMSVLEFKDYLMDFILEHQPSSRIEPLTPQEEAYIQKRADEKFSTWEWNYGASPKYAIERKMRTKGGTVQINMDVKNGIINDVRIFGDFFSQKNPDELASMLIGKTHNRIDLQNVLCEIDVQQYLSGVTEEELLWLLG